MSCVTVANTGNFPIAPEETGALGSGKDCFNPKEHTPLQLH